ncbi:uncharacterized protein MEPE_03127 [Melanopsichium pennsylvanicum]|uniref:Cell cycle control protein cwf19 n=2 Tax=Melanopsichium pennsylvanicum TaxID=63383 RepID=A0AAJ5C5C1_9BASI|nr:uncharacterized protein MEPE_03127 [Melanopsichium pennsylvanicum]
MSKAVSDSGQRDRDREERDRHRLRYHSNSSRRHDDQEDRKHGSRSNYSNSRRNEEDPHSIEDRDRHGDHHRHHSHRSSHQHRHDSSSSRREREIEAERSERKRRRREAEKEDSKRDESRYTHRSNRHHDVKAESNRSSGRNKDPHAHHNEQEKQPATDFIPTSESLSLTSNASAQAEGSTLITDSNPTSTTLKRDDWMTGGFTNAPAENDGISYFSTLGRERVRPQRSEKSDPEKLKISSRELNIQLVEGKSVDEYSTPANSDSRPAFGAPGHQWRMLKLKRTLEAAQEEKGKGKTLQEVALDRYATLDDFHHAMDEKRFLDRKGEQVQTQVPVTEKANEFIARRGTPNLQSIARRSYMLATGGSGGEVEGSGTDSEVRFSRPGSRQGFRRPGESCTPTPVQSKPSAPRNVGFESPTSSQSTTPTTAVPSVFTPVFELPTSTAAPSLSEPQAGVVIDDGSTDPDRPVLTSDQLNKLQAQIFKAELMGDSSLDSLKAEYERESARAAAHKEAGDRGGAFASSSLSSTRNSDHGHRVGVLVGDGSRELQVLPTLDARGRLYDVGSQTLNPESAPVGSKRKLKGRDTFEARDSKTGSIVRYSADDDAVSLGDLVRQEKFSAGSKWEKEPDAELAANIVSDIGYTQDLDEQDEEAHRYAKKKIRSDALKRQFAINDFAKTKRALDRCRFCWQDEGARPPKVTVVSSGYRTYLAIPDNEAVTETKEDHVIVVPMQHHLSLLEADDDTWDEMRNFQKCLVQMADGMGKVAVFFETLLNIKNQAHAVMEAVMVPKPAMDLLPGVFKESLRAQGSEWSTHGKVIQFSTDRPFRNALVSNLAYFAVTWDYKWSCGYGHVIENMDREDAGKEGEGDAYDVDEMAAGYGGGGGSAGKFDPNFARDIIRGVLQDLDNENNSSNDGVGLGMGSTRSFGKSKRRSDEEKRKVKHKFAKSWEHFDWTKQLQS